MDVNTTNRVLAVLAPVVLVLAACSPPDEVDETVAPRPVKIITPASSRTAVVHSYPGVIQASEQAELSFRVSGQLFELPAKSQSSVRRGELLARLDQEEFLKDVEDKEVKLRLARTQFEQIERLRGQNLVSKLEYDEAETQLKAARIELDFAQGYLRFTSLRAPFTGVVGKVYVENFQTVEKNDRILHLQNIDELEIEFSIPERHLIGLERRSAEDEREFCGRMSMTSKPGNVISACFSRFESVPDSVTRNYTVYFSFPRPTDLNVLPGMSASIELDMTELLPAGSEATFHLPLGAIFEKDGGSWVWRVTDDMTTEPVAVELVELRENVIEVKSTLTADDRIIGAAAGEIREGMQVREIVRERGL